ncbi:MAG: hypothetical protein GX629_05455 [Phycisphaerae bacterium]|nr:hypothetical protein [Phycisphaerae bacterium]
MNLKRRKTYLGQNNMTVEPVTWYRTVLGLFIGIAIMVLATLITGCSHQQDETISYLCFDPQDQIVSPKLILRSSKEQSIDPQIIACRSDWPSTTGDLELSRITSYRQYWHDRQSASANIPDYSYRRTESYRYGESFR